MSRTNPLLLLLTLLAGCAGAPGFHTPQPGQTAQDPSPTVTSPIAEANQMILVTARDWDSSSGTMQRFQRHHGDWQPVGAPSPVSLGREGIGWGRGLHPMPQPGPEANENRARSPAGVFALSSAFGYAPTSTTTMRYRPMQINDYCIDVPTSPLYNRIVDITQAHPDEVAGATEPMRLDLHNHGDQRYAMGLVVEHNPQAIPGQGSCIFVHLWRQPGEVTAGCTAMDEPAMRTLFDWLDPDQHPVLVLLPMPEYRRLASAWQLP